MVVLIFSLTMQALRSRYDLIIVNQRLKTLRSGLLLRFILSLPLSKQGKQSLAKFWHYQKNIQMTSDNVNKSFKKNKTFIDNFGQTPCSDTCSPFPDHYYDDILLHVGHSMFSCCLVVSILILILVRVDGSSQC